MLRQLVLSNKIAGLRTAMSEIETAKVSLEERRAELVQREADLVAAVGEVTSETPADEKAVLDESAEQFIKDDDALKLEETANETECADLERQITELQNELDGLNARAKVIPEEKKVERKETITMQSRMKFFKDMAVQTRDAIMSQEDVQSFVTRMRDMKDQKRAVTGGELGISTVLLDVLHDTLHTYSKLLPYVHLVKVPGKARQTIAGTVPEGVWTEACAKLNELALSFAQVEVDGYKVGGFIPVCNALLEDSEINLVDEVMYAIGQAIGFALDKAILYGTGTKMPLGIVTRLAQTSEPGTWGTNAPTWTDLHSANVKKLDPGTLTPEAYFSQLITAAGVVKGNYASTGKKFWAMNSKTFAVLQAKALVINAAGVIMSGQNMTMPIIGGDVVILEFMADNTIVGGYGELYLLAERAGAQLAVSEHVRFTEDQTVFRGTARYDGMPIYGEAFVTMNIANANVATTATFPSDDANP